MIPILKLDKVSKSYKVASKKKQAESFALGDISFKLMHSEILGLIGKSGAGKSTLLRCLNLLEKPSSGKVIFKEEDLNTLSPSDLRMARQKIGMIFQQFNLLSSRNVFGNVSLPLELAGVSKDKIKAKVDELLGFVGLSDYKIKYPDQLSGGQKQRVAIARALALDPEVLLCDEATSALDPETTKEILQLLKRANTKFKVSIILITHQMEVVKQICHRVGVLDAGKLVEIGSVIGVFMKPKSAAAKKLSQELFTLHLPAELANKLHKTAKKGSQPIIKSIFVGKSAQIPVASVLLEKFGIKTNIIQADLGQVNDQTVGFTVGLWDGEAAKIKLAKEYLLDIGVEVTVVGYV